MDKVAAAQQQTPAAENDALPRRSHLVMWLAMLALVVVLVVALVVGARAAVLVLSASLLVLAVVRAVAPAPGPYGISTRSRAFDVTLLAAAAVFMAAVTLSLPSNVLS